jgi:hypothetical protein
MIQHFLRVDKFKKTDAAIVNFGLSSDKVPGVKQLLTIISILTIAFIGCTKQHKGQDCTIVTITQSASGCSGWGIVVHGVKYPSENIPTEFQHDGMEVCANYELYEDMRMCICCGGTWANITSIRKL